MQEVVVSSLIFPDFVTQAGAPGGYRPEFGGGGYGRGGGGGGGGGEQ